MSRIFLEKIHVGSGSGKIHPDPQHCPKGQFMPVFVQYYDKISFNGPEEKVGSPAVRSGKKI